MNPGARTAPDIMRFPPQAIVLACVVASLVAACGPQDEAPPPGTITGRERVWWDQQAPDAEELSRYSYVLYIDGIVNALPLTTCGALAGDGPIASCSSPLPAIAPGQHTLELATRLTWEGTVLESERSAPVVVTVAASAAASAFLALPLPAAAVAPGPGRVRASDTEPFVVETLITGLDQPTSLAFLPDGRLLIAERGGRVRVAAPGTLLPTLALVLDDMAPAAEDGTSLALAADFEESHHVYLGYVAADDEGRRTGRVVRYREVSGTLGEAAVIVEGLPAAIRAPRATIGPDGLLYVAVAASDPGAADDLGSYEGKILRFEVSGATPADNPYRFSPVLSFGHRGRLATAWAPDGKSLWYVESDEGGVALGRVGRARQQERPVSLDGIQAAGMTFHAGANPAAWRHDLFLASPEDACLYRLTVVAESPPQFGVEKLFARRFGRIAVVLSADDGLCFATGNGTDQRGEPADAVFRIRDR